jgi:hypothetical protein
MRNSRFSKETVIAALLGAATATTGLGCFGARWAAGAGTSCNALVDL